MYSKLLVGLIKILGGYNHIVYQIFIGGQEAISYINTQCRQVTAQILVGTSGGKCGAAALLDFRVLYIIYCLVSYVCIYTHAYLHCLRMIECVNNDTEVDLESTTKTKGRSANTFG